MNALPLAAALLLLVCACCCSQSQGARVTYKTPRHAGRRRHSEGNIIRGHPRRHSYRGSRRPPPRRRADADSDRTITIVVGLGKACNNLCARPYVDGRAVGKCVMHECRLGECDYDTGTCVCIPPTVPDARGTKCIEPAKKATGGRRQHGPGADADSDRTTTKVVGLGEACNNLCAQPYIDGRFVGECVMRECGQGECDYDTSTCKCAPPTVPDRHGKACRRCRDGPTNEVVRLGGECTRTCYGVKQRCEQGECVRQAGAHVPRCTCAPPTVPDTEREKCIEPPKKATAAEPPATTTMGAKTTTTTMGAMTTAPFTIQGIYFDVVVLLDGSLSVNKKNFELAKRYVSTFAKRRDDASLHISAYEFSYHVGDGFHLTVRQKPDKFVTDEIAKIRYSAISTHTGDALEAAGEELAKYSRLYRKPADVDKDKVRKAVVLLTDGKPSSQEEAEEAAQKLRKQDTTIITVAVGRKANSESTRQKLINITGSDKLVFPANYEDMERAANPLIELLRACYECVTTTGAKTCDDKKCAHMLPA